MYAIGLMSGTSLDGIDAVLCEVNGVNEATAVRQIAFLTHPMPADLRSAVQDCCQCRASADVICSLNFQMGEIFADAANAVIKQAGMKAEEISFIASHGQTIYHIPFSRGSLSASTLQIGEPAVIAQRCQIPVISDFRSMDMAVGGQGAPLVPYSEYVLCRRSDQSVALQNIGGIGNVTVLPQNCSIQDVYAFDTGPGNMMIDEAMLQLYQKPYDPDGTAAAEGRIIPSMQKTLMAHPYLQISPPKSTGRDMFGKDYVDELLHRWKDEKKEDIIRTLTWFTAYSIARSYRDFVFPRDQISTCILSGGGAYNKTLHRMLSRMLRGCRVITQEDVGFSSEAKEAVAFVILGNQTWHHLPSNVPSATGASRPVILGSITYPF